MCKYNKYLQVRTASSLFCLKWLSYFLIHQRGSRVTCEHCMKIFAHKCVWLHMKFRRLFLHAPIYLFPASPQESCSLFTTPSLHYKSFPSLDLRAGGWGTLESMLREHFVLQAFPPPIVQPKQHKPSGAAGYPPADTFSVQFILSSSVHKVTKHLLPPCSSKVCQLLTILHSV